MTTESTETARLVPPGEPFTDLLDELEELARRSNSRGDDFIPIDEFYVELNRIDRESRRRKGETYRPFPTGGAPEPGHVPTDDDLEEAFCQWIVVKAGAENRKPAERYYTPEEILAEFPDEFGDEDDSDLGAAWGAAST